MGIKINNYLGRNFNKERVPDKQSIQSRSSQMSKIRSKNTHFEEDFISKFRKNYKGIFKTHVRTIKGTPDIVLEDKQICVFLDSDFWHGWQYPRWKHLLKDDFWRTKIETNRKRDKKVTRLLKKDGWKVIRFWEHYLLKDSPSAIKKIIRTTL